MLGTVLLVILILIFFGGLVPAFGPVPRSGVRSPIYHGYGYGWGGGGGIGLILVIVLILVLLGRI